MRSRSIGIATPYRQRGWAGIVALLLALLVIAILGQKMLREYGLAARAASGPSSQKSAARPTDAATGAAADATAATQAPANAIERARGVEATIQQQADQAAKRIDEQTR